MVEFQQIIYGQRSDAYLHNITDTLNKKIRKEKLTWSIQIKNGGKNRR